jgi:hypothetical protein
MLKRLNCQFPIDMSTLKISSKQLYEITKLTDKSFVGCKSAGVKQTKGQSRKTFIKSTKEKN